MNTKNSFLEYLESILSDNSKDENIENSKNESSPFLRYLDSMIDAYYDEIQKYLNKVENKETEESREIPIEDNKKEEIEEIEEKSNTKNSIVFMDSINQVPENIKNNVTNCAVEYFDHIIYPNYIFNEIERKHIIEVLSDFACWIYKNK